MATRKGVGEVKCPHCGVEFETEEEALNAEYLAEVLKSPGKNLMEKIENHRRKVTYEASASMDRVFSLLLEKAKKEAEK